MRWSSRRVRTDGCTLHSVRRMSNVQPLLNGSAYVSRHLPPWLLIIIPCAPTSRALCASAALWIPLMTIGKREVSLIHATSSQFNVRSMYRPMSLPKPPPCLSLPASAPLTGEDTVSAATLSSASRFPGTCASTVMKIALTPSWRAFCRS